MFDFILCLIALLTMCVVTFVPRLRSSTPACIVAGLSPIYLIPFLAVYILVVMGSLLVLRCIVRLFTSAPESF